MSPIISKSETIRALLQEYIRGYRQNAPDGLLLKRVLELLPHVNDPEELRPIAEHAWDDFLGVDVLVLIQVLRRWLELDPSNKEAMRHLGSYLLCHGPDWDGEGRQLLEEAKS
jgi:hypothetical protein